MDAIKFTPSDGISYNPNEEIYWDENALRKEIDRTFEICHSCRMCFKYCDTFPSIFNLIDFLSEQKKQKGVKITGLDDFDEYTISLIVEIGNILAGHYTSALANLLSTRYIPDVPFLAFDKLGAIVNELLTTCSEDLDFLLMINTKMVIDDLDFSGIFCFIPSVETLDKFFEKSGNLRYLHIVDII